MLKKLAARFRAQALPVDPAAPASRAAILDLYVRDAPSPQTALDIFKGEWWSSLPGELAAYRAGQMPLFNDTRMPWALEALGGVAGKTVLELGPLEGGHTYALEQAGAKSVLAIEANTKCFLKCLVTKEIVGLTRSRFMLGDFEQFLRASGERFDAIFASGVIYHMRNPVELIQNLARATDRVFIWTQYYDKDRLAAIPHQAHRFGQSSVAEVGGFRHTLYRNQYKDLLDTSRYMGGTEEYSNWLSRDDLLGALRHAGLSEIVIGEEEVGHANGPAISLVARRPGS